MAATAGGSQRGREVADEVRLTAIHRETIRKENRSLRRNQEATLNPYRQVHAVTGKPMSWHDNQSEAADYDYLRIIHHAALEPTKKYTEPQTTSQEIGWITKPLIDTDRTDWRLHHYRHNSEITAYMEQAWRLKEQSVNLQ